MPSSETIFVLNRLLGILSRSFMQYLVYARPYIPAGHEQFEDTLSEIAQAQTALADRVAETIYDQGTLPDTGRFPMEFTDTHDLSIDYLIRSAVEYQRRDVEAIRECAAAASLAPAARSLADEALGMAQGQLESLEELLSQLGTNNTAPGEARKAPTAQ